MFSATLKAIDCTEKVPLWCLIEKIVLKFGFEKKFFFFLNKIPFLYKAFHEIFLKGITLFLSTSTVLDR